MAQVANLSIKRGNRRTVLALLRQSGAIDVSHISQTTKLSKMTVHKILDHYVEIGLITPAGKGESAGEVGKKPNLFRLNHEYRYIYSMQIFETSLLAAVTDLDARVLLEKRVSHAKDSPLEPILDKAWEVFSEMAAELGIAADGFASIVVGTSGVTDFDAGVVFTLPHFSSWGVNVPLRDMLRRRFPSDITIHIDNWARYQAYAEMKIGSARRQTRFMVIGTEPDGVCAGLVWDGVPLRGQHGLAGEIGHMQVDPDLKDVCACGGVGCLEAAISLANMIRDIRNDYPARSDSSLFRGKKPEDITPRDVFAHADAGDSLAQEYMDRNAKFLAMAINNTVQVCDPELIIIQGEYASAGEYFMNALKTRVRNISLPNMDKGTRIVYSTFGQQGVIGAAHFAADEFFARMG